MTDLEATTEQSEKIWPADSLEYVLKCPVCGEAEREILHPALMDNTFRAASGKWTLWKCARCNSAYLDPRPSKSSIHLAYANYYTHKPVSAKCEYSDLSLLRKIRRVLVNGYINWKYSGHNSPSSSLGVLAAFLLPGMRKVPMREYRHLPRLPKGGGALLDVGCGDSSFLKLARSCGWDVVGLDSDPAAAANAANTGLSVDIGGIEFYDGKCEIFDAITLSHVIEHVYDPVKVLASCHRLLKSGGHLWIETPNIDSFGHSYFQNNWRGLEAPRHLVLFNRASLCKALVIAGFQLPSDRASPSPCQDMYQASYAMARGLMPSDAVEIKKAVKLNAFLTGILGLLLPSRREFLTLSARKAI